MNSELLEEVATNLQLVTSGIVEVKESMKEIHVTLHDIDSNFKTLPCRMPQKPNLRARVMDKVDRFFLPASVAIIIVGLTVFAYAVSV